MQWSKISLKSGDFFEGAFDDLKPDEILEMIDFVSVFCYFKKRYTGILEENSSSLYQKLEF